MGAGNTNINRSENYLVSPTKYNEYECDGPFQKTRSKHNEYMKLVKCSVNLKLIDPG